MIRVRADEFDIESYPLCAVSRVEAVVSHSSDGIPITIPVIVLAGQRRRPRVALVAGVHGDEYEGPRALAELAKEIDVESLDGSVMIVPVAHRAAYGAGTRVSPIDGVNLARVFPGDPSGTVTERLAHSLFQHILSGADHIADLHSAGTKCLHLPLAGFYDVPGAVGEASRAAAQAWGFEYLWSVPHRAGVLSYEAISAGIPATGGEVGGQGGCRSEDVDKYKLAMRNLLKHLGLVEGSRIAPAAARQRALSADWLPTPCSGLLVTHVGLGQPIRKGERLLTLYDIYGDVLERMSAPWTGVVAGIRTFGTIHEGEWVICLLREEVMHS